MVACLVDRFFTGWESQQETAQRVGGGGGWESSRLSLTWLGQLDILSCIARFCAWKLRLQLGGGVLCRVSAGR